MCYDEGTLQAYLDHELPGRKRWEIEAHIAACGACAQRLTQLEAAGEVAQPAIARLSHELGTRAMATDAAWVRLSRDERFGASVDKKGVFRMLHTRAKAVLIPLAAAAVLAIALSVAPVREAAADFLNIFRVERVETITITPDDIEEMRRLGGPDGGRVSIENFGTIESSGLKQPAQSSLAGAKAAVDFDLRLPGGLEGYGAPQFNVRYGFTTNFTLDVEKANKALTSFGAKKLLPAELDGKTFTAKMPTTVIANYARDAGGMVTVAQARSPEFILPGDVDADDVRDALLSVPVLPENIRSQLEAIKDWRHTLIVPNVNGSTQEVAVDGAEGVFIAAPKETPSGDRVLAWQKDGVIYAISGQIDLATAQQIAGSMK